MTYRHWIWQQAEWPHFSWDDGTLRDLLARIRMKQGRLIGMMSGVGFDVQTAASVDTMVEDVIRSSEIEGVILNADRVRSSIAMRLGLPTEGLPVPDHYTEGVVQVMMDAVRNAQHPLTEERLFGWHCALFPTGHSGPYKIRTGTWRSGEESMQVVSGAMGHEKVHYEAPPSDAVPTEMQTFLDWVNAEPGIDPVLKAAIAHLWFVSIHPFEDGNGRITRTITDMLLARADEMPQRFYSMSAAIMQNRKAYYDVLEATTSGGIDITQWLMWFLQTLEQAVDNSMVKTQRVLKKALFWQRNREVVLNERQVKVVNRLWDGFEGNLTSGKYAKMTHTSQPTAFRDIENLIAKGILRKAEGGGRSTHYELVEDSDQ